MQWKKTVKYSLFKQVSYIQQTQCYWFSALSIHTKILDETTSNKLSTAATNKNAHIFSWYLIFVQFQDDSQCFFYHDQTTTNHFLGNKCLMIFKCAHLVENIDNQFLTKFNREDCYFDNCTRTLELDWNRMFLHT